MNAASYLNGGPDIASESTLLSAILRAPGDAAAAVEQVGSRLKNGSLILTGTLRDMSTADWQEVLVDGTN